MFDTLKQKLFGGGVSRQHAKSRLHFVLVQDRTGLSGDDMAEFKHELMQVIDKYFVINKTGFDVAYKREGESTTLLINSPVVVRRQEGGLKGVAGAKTRKKKNKTGSAAASA